MAHRYIKSEVKSKLRSPLISRLRHCLQPLASLRCVPALVLFKWTPDLRRAQISAAFPGEPCPETECPISASSASSPLSWDSSRQWEAFPRIHSSGGWPGRNPLGISDHHRHRSRSNTRLQAAFSTEESTVETRCTRTEPRIIPHISAAFIQTPRFISTSAARTPRVRARAALILLTWVFVCLTCIRGNLKWNNHTCATVILARDHSS